MNQNDERKKDIMERPIEISVIVITYNQEDTIGRTLDSILRQKVDVPFEIVIGDDCSSDHTEKVCRRYAEKYPEIIRYFRRDKNLGVVRNYFQCIENCRGRFIADCAGDDVWVDDRKLQLEYDVMNADPEVSLVHTDWNEADLDGGNVRRPEMMASIDRSNRTVSKPGELLLPIFQRRPEAYIHLCSAMYRADLIKKEMQEHPEIYICPEYGCEDFQIAAGMAALGKVVYLPVVTLNYSISGHSVSHHVDFGKKYRQVRGALTMIQRLSDYFHIKAEEIADYYSLTLDYLCAQVFHSGSSEMLKDYQKFISENKLDRFRSKKTKLREDIMGSQTVWQIMLKVIGKKESK